MPDIIEKYKAFYKEDFGNYKDLFERLGSGQKPHTLFISCSDSRVVPELITKSLPGELFVVRTVANIVPPYDNSDISSTVSSAIEYAVMALEVENIVICGHYNCGGCAALHLEESKLDDKPSLKKWIRISKDVARKAVETVGSDTSMLYTVTERLNVVKQIENILTYPFVKERFENKKIKIYGWHYIIPTGELYNYNFDTKTFEKVVV